MSTENSDALLAWQTWLNERNSSVTSAQGNLALIQTTWLGAGAVVNKEEALSNQPSTVQITELERKDFTGAVIDRGYRLWDSHSKSIQNFSHIDSYDFNPNFIYTGTFTSFGENKPVAFEYIRDNGGTRDLAVPGEINVEIEGVTYHLNAFDDDGTLLLVFGDPTNGVETYTSGRFLFVHREDNSNQVTIDFNRAFVPPCGFSINYNCPLPPKQNRIDIPIKAGEKNPVFNNEYSIYTL